VLLPVGLRHYARVSAVYLVDASDAGHGVIDRELYLPRAWTADPSACRLRVSPTRSGLRPSRPWPRR
jgi:hypothetical protein